LWQKSIGRIIPKTHDLDAFDLFHHVTFNSFEVVPSLINCFPGIKVWGPIGGGQCAPVPLTATLSLKGRLKERLRSLRISLSRRNPRLIRCLESCDWVLFANEETRDLFQPVELKSSGQMIDVGVDPTRFTPPGEYADGHRIFSASNFEARKGTRLLLMAFKKAHRKNSKLRLRLAGEGPESPRERAWVEANGLDEVITFSGRCSHAEMAEEFANADVFVFPSIRDTSGAIVLEAMACGLPVVCLNHQGAKLMVDENEGIRVPPKKLKLTVRGIAAAILELSGDASLREALGKNARERVLCEFTWEKKADRLGNGYQRLCHVEARRGRPRPTF
jgi:glycosyltransferase involved in cell wall biosynthesis